MKTAEEDTQIAGQRRQQVHHLIRAEIVDSGRLAGQKPFHRALHLRTDVLDVAVLAQVVDQESEGSDLRIGRQILQVRRDHPGGVPAGGYHCQQKLLRLQKGPELRPAQFLGALEIPSGECEPSALAALIGGFEEADGLQIQNSFVVGGAQARLGQSMLGPAVRVPGVMKRGQLQPGIRILGEAGRHLLQDAPEPGLVVPVSPQQIEEEAITFAVAGIGIEARHHQFDKQHLGLVDPTVQQCGQRLHHPGRQVFGMLDGLMAGSSQGLEHAASGQSPIRGSRKLYRQPLEVGGGRRRIPGVRGQPLEQQLDSGKRAGNPLGRKETAHEPADRLHGELVPLGRQPGDLQQVHAGRVGVVGTEDIGQADDRSFDNAWAVFPAQSLAQLLAQDLDRRADRSQCPLHLDRSTLPFAGTQASPFGNRVGEGKVGRQQVEGSAQPLVVTGAETHHGLAEHAPSRERGAPGHPSQKLGHPLPVSGVHGIETAHDLPGVSPQRMVRIKGFDTLPAPPDHEQVRQRPFGLVDGRPGVQVIRVDRKRIGPVQVADVPRQVLRPQRPGGDGRPMLSGPGAHGGGFSVQAVPRQLPGALDAGAEEQQGQSLRIAVFVLRLSELIESPAPVPVGQALPSLLQQMTRGYVPRLRPLVLSVSAAVLAGCHVFFAEESLAVLISLRSVDAAHEQAPGSGSSEHLDGGSGGRIKQAAPERSSPNRQKI